MKMKVIEEMKLKINELKNNAGGDTNRGIPFTEDEPNQEFEKEVFEKLEEEAKDEQ
ncbi:MAG: hypothetical protein ACRCUS_06840 [Anaerovoracaceae bacterium]